jgi:flagellar biosynthesis GTPase FlhF
LIDYDYEEETSSSESIKQRSKHPRRAKKIAERRIRRAVRKDEASSASQSSESIPELPTIRRKKPSLVVEEYEGGRGGSSSGGMKKSASTSSNLTSLTARSKGSAAAAPTTPDRKTKPTPPNAPPRRRQPVIEEESEEEEEDDDFDEEEEDEMEDDSYETTEDDEDMELEDDEDDEDDDDEEDEKPRGKKAGITLFELLNGEEDDPRKPKKYNLKKEPANVRRFVELVQQENEEEDNIDNDITYFKSLSAEKQLALMKILEQKAAPTEVQVPLKFKILEKVSNNPDLARVAMSKYNALMNIDPSSTEYYKCSHWINGFTGLPLGVFKDLPVRIEDGPEKCQDFMGLVAKNMDDAIYGHEDAKLQIMQFISSWIANPKAHGNVMSIHGPPGIGKTSLIKDGVAKALGRPFHFITLGGATDASFLDGHSYTYEGSTWGKIVDVLIQSKCMNPVIYFDELDKVSETPKGEEIMNMLIHITDGSQNDRFQDKYFTGINLDLSRCLFIFSHNDHGRVNPILKDRMYNIEVKGFDAKQKLQIAEKYLVGAALQEVGLFEKVSLGREIIQHIIEHYTGGEQGVRELKRCIQTVVSKINLLRFFNNSKQVPFAIEGFGLPFTVKKSHIELFLKRKDGIDASIAHLYT